MSFSRSLNLLKNVKNSLVVKSQVRHAGGGDHGPKALRSIIFSLVRLRSALFVSGSVIEQRRHITLGFRWLYRKSYGHRVPKESLIVGDGLVAFATWWIVWHIWHEPGHIVGEFTYPDPSKWTDAELGIPPDDEE